MKYSVHFSLLLLAVFCIVIPPLAYADKSLIKQRAIFQQAEKALKKNQISKFHKLNKKLKRLSTATLFKLFIFAA